MQAFRRNVLGICEESVKKRTSSEQRALLYLYPPNLTSAGAVDEIDGIEIIEVEVNLSTTDGRGLKTVLKVFHITEIYCSMDLESGCWLTCSLCSLYKLLLALLFILT